MRLDYRKLRQPAVVYAAVVGTTLLLVLVLFLTPVNDTHRWIRLGALSFQPAELAKLAVILFLAYHLERRGGPRQRVPALALPGAAAARLVRLPHLHPARPGHRGHARR